jgi:glycosyltransferase involved in cell wall biosynthesis
MIGIFGAAPRGARLATLPPPPAGKSGWPWTEETPARGPLHGQARDWPRITIVTPSFNQGEFLEATLRSVLLQGYPNLEYIVIDGGSSDDSVTILKRYAPWLSWWVSERDGGQSAAVNRGLQRGTGSLASWINSDDMLCKGALVELVSRASRVPGTVWVGACLYIDADGIVQSSHTGRIHSLEELVRVPSFWRANRHIDQPAVLFPRELVLGAGGLDPANHATMDYDLWGRLFLAGAVFRYVSTPVGMFREHDRQKTHDVLRQTESLIASALRLTEAAPFAERAKERIRAELEDYLDAYRAAHWNASGRLARLGLPRPLVARIRRLRARLEAGRAAGRVGASSS